MFHHEISSAVMQERARDLRASAKNARDARVLRRALKFWAEETAQQAGRRPRRRSQARAAGVTGR